MSDDEWRECAGFPGYEVSNHGEVRNASTGRPMSTFGRSDGSGYLYVCLRKGDRKKNVLVHRLVAKAFVENPDPATKTQVNHKDECKRNNCAYNLEWVTCSENSRYGTGRARRAEKQSLPVVMVYRGLSVMFNSATDAELRTGIPAKSIQKCCTGRLASTHGASFAYLGGRPRTIGDGE